MNAVVDLYFVRDQRRCRNNLLTRVFIHKHPTLSKALFLVFFVYTLLINVCILWSYSFHPAHTHVYTSLPLLPHAFIHKRYSVTFAKNFKCPCILYSAISIILSTWSERFFHASNADVTSNIRRWITSVSLLSIERIISHFSPDDKILKIYLSMGRKQVHVNANVSNILSVCCLQLSQFIYSRLLVLRL